MWGHKGASGWMSLPGDPQGHKVTADLMIMSYLLALNSLQEFLRNQLSVKSHDWSHEWKNNHTYWLTLLPLWTFSNLLIGSFILQEKNIFKVNFSLCYVFKCQRITCEGNSYLCKSINMDKRSHPASGHSGGCSDADEDDDFQRVSQQK